MTEYTEQERLHRAQEALRLMNEPILAEMLEGIRMESLLELAETEPTDANKIRQLQAIVVCTGEIRARLMGMIAAGGSLDGGLNPNEATG